MQVQRKGRKDPLTVSAKYYYWKLAMAYWSFYELSAYQRVAAFSENEKILDIGCGDGTFGRMLRETLNFENRFMGVDVDKNSVVEAKNKDEYEKVYCCKGSNLPFEAGEFENVFSNQVLHCIPRGPDRTLKEISRVLKRGGKFICTVLTKNSMKNIYIADKLEKWKMKSASKYYKKMMKKRLPVFSCLSVAEWRRKIESSKMSVKKVHPFMYGERYKIWSILMTLPFRVMGFTKFLPEELKKHVESLVTKVISSIKIENNKDKMKSPDSVVICAEKT